MMLQSSSVRQAHTNRLALMEPCGFHCCLAEAAKSIILQIKPNKLSVAQVFCRLLKDVSRFSRFGGLKEKGINPYGFPI
ncbi:hypothetical protein OUZ56_031236 [Daphnia magna]|uniref:Uncharacterized protein n=1 Tax=Daphnia magna TaxID=35525 RepID=A0ABQ9ZUH8_9CRUS|nr:hypothetical protein OUZ56_031236 [Daphnia magna]